MSTASNTPKSLKQWATWARNRVRRNQHVVAVVTGDPGKGKSGFTLMLSRKLQDSFDVRKQVLFEAFRGPRVARTLPRYSVIDYDEAVVKGGNRRRAMSTDNVEQMTFLNTCRKMNHIQFYLYPFFEDADSAVQKHAQWVFEIPKHGEVVAYSVEVIGGPKKKSIWLEERFRDRFPNCEEVLPDLWAEYQAHVDAYVWRKEDPLADAKREELERLRGVVRAHLHEDPGGSLVPAR